MTENKKNIHLHAWSVNSNSSLIHSVLIDFLNFAASKWICMIVYIFIYFNVNVYG